VCGSERDRLLGQHAGLRVQRFTHAERALHASQEQHQPQLDRQKLERGLGAALGAHDCSTISLPV
jgi:hypothetical protein